MEINNCAVAPLTPQENYTVVSVDTLDKVFPVSATTQAVEISVAAAPPRTPRETRKLSKTLFFKRG